MNINPFITLLHNIIYLFNLLLIVYIILNWLIAFNIVNRYQPFVARVYEFLNRVTEPVLRPIRRLLPDVGGIDLSPIVVVLLLNFIDNAMYTYFYQV